MNELEFWREACDNTDEAVCLMSYNNKFVCCNNSWSNLFGYKESELIDKTWMSLTKSNDLIKTYSALQTVKDLNTDYFFNKTCYDKDSHEFMLDLYVRRFDTKEDNFLIIGKQNSNKEELKGAYFDLKQKALVIKQQYLSKVCKDNNSAIAECKIAQNDKFNSTSGFSTIKGLNKKIYFILGGMIITTGVFSAGCIVFFI